MAKESKALFITLEGGEGVGKSTLQKSLYRDLSERGYEVILTREPGGTNGAELIRNLLVTGDKDRWNAISEMCLFYAAREDHLDKLIRPALNDNKIIICDRFFDSTRAYQGILGQNEANIMKVLEDNIVGPTMPNITLILDIEIETGLKRANNRGDNEGRFESKGLKFHENLRNAFLNIAKNEPERCKIIDANQSQDKVHEIALNIILDALD